MSEASPATPYRAGLVALVGRPNVGKSTLLNALVGERVSIVTPKPQTTRHRILGIHSTEAGQIVYVDTPGLHRDARRAMNRVLNRAARGALADVQLAVLVIEALRFDDEDRLALEAIREAGVPMVLAINKVDAVKDKGKLLPFIARLSQAEGIEDIYPVSARKRTGLAELEAGLLARMPESEPLYDPEEFTDRSERFLAAELVREQLMRQLGAELPYSCTVEIERFEDDAGMARIAAVVWVERASQKGIVIGAGGERLKRIGQEARQAMERLFDRKVFLQLWCKVREGWSDDEAALRQLGYGD